MSSEDQEFFKKTKWCARLLADRSFKAIETITRQPKDSTEDSFFAETLRSSNTIARCLTLCRIPADEKTPELKELRMLLSMGSGNNGHAHILHGGFVATVLDEAMGLLVTLSKQRRLALNPADKTAETFTAYMNVLYKKPVPTPGLMLVTAEAVSIKGRKWLLKSSVEDGEGTVYATGETLFIEVKEKL